MGSHTVCWASRQNKMGGDVVLDIAAIGLEVSSSVVDTGGCDEETALICSVLFSFLDFALDVVMAHILYTDDSLSALGGWMIAFLVLSTFATSGCLMTLLHDTQSEWDSKRSVVFACCTGPFAIPYTIAIGFVRSEQLLAQKAGPFCAAACFPIVAVAVVVLFTGLCTNPAAVWCFYVMRLRKKCDSDSVISTTLTFVGWIEDLPCFIIQCVAASRLDPSSFAFTIQVVSLLFSAYRLGVDTLHRLLSYGILKPGTQNPGT